jgi:UDP-glucose 4-epimerase
MIVANGRIRRKVVWLPQHDDVHVILRHALAWEQRLQSLAEAKS